MTVLLPNAQLAAAARPVGTRDAHGALVPAASGPPRGPYPGHITEQPDGTWVLMLDPRCGPLRPGDVVTQPAAGRAWTLTGLPTEYRNEADPLCDYLEAAGRLEEDGATDPPGWYPVQDGA